MLIIILLITFKFIEQGIFYIKLNSKIFAKVITTNTMIKSYNNLCTDFDILPIKNKNVFKAASNAYGLDLGNRKTIFIDKDNIMYRNMKYNEEDLRYEQLFDLIIIEILNQMNIKIEKDTLNNVSLKAKADISKSYEINLDNLKYHVWYSEESIVKILKFK